MNVDVLCMQKYVFFLAFTNLPILIWFALRMVFFAVIGIDYKLVENNLDDFSISADCCLAVYIPKVFLFRLVSIPSMRICPNMQ